MEYFICYLTKNVVFFLGDYLSNDSILRLTNTISFVLGASGTNLKMLKIYVQITFSYY